MIMVDCKYIKNNKWLNMKCVISRMYNQEYFWETEIIEVGVKCFLLYLRFRHFSERVTT